MLFITPKLRGTDAQGSGAYGAPRGDRKHKGVDYACRPGTNVYSAIRGIVTRLGYPYRWSREFRLIEIRTDQDDLVRYLYVKPAVTKGQLILPGSLLGTVQKLPYKGITQHVHVDVRRLVNQRRKYVNPVEYFDV